MGIWPNGNCGQKLKEAFISLRKHEVQRKFSWRTVTVRDKQGTLHIEVSAQKQDRVKSAVIAVPMRLREAGYPLGVMYTVWTL